MQSGLLARTLSGRLATKLSRHSTCQTTGFATKEAAAAGVPDREKETKLQTLLKVTSCHLQPTKVQKGLVQPDGTGNVLESGGKASNTNFE